MRRFITVLFLTALLSAVSTGFAQNFCAVLYETTQQLDSICGGSTHPIADGTIIQIMWDRGATGPSPEDTLAPACVCDNCIPGTVNFNTFAFNGADPNIGLLPGQFYTLDYAFCSNNILPTPDTFYLMVCLPGRHYYSNTFSPSVGYSEFEMGPWTCLNQPCTGSPIPQAPTNFVATDSTTCNGVNLSWSYPDTVHQLDGFALFRNDSCRIAQVGPTARTYLDAMAVSGTRFTYFVEALRHAGTDTAYSSWQTDFGSSLPGPAIPSSMSVASSCTTVTVTFFCGNPAGTDFFVIRRDADSVGSTPALPPGTHVFAHHTTNGAAAQYTVVGWRQACGYGTPFSPSQTGQAAQRPAQVQGVSATDAGCDSTIITWTDVSGETAYQVWRSLNDGTQPTDLTPAGLPANTVRYRDITGSLATTYRYWVLAVNTCGASVASAFDTGYRLQTPGQPFGFLASDSALCDRVHLTWNDVTGEQGYKIIRVLGSVTDTLGPVPGDTLHFEDLTALAGQIYTYSVLAYSACGSSVPSTSDLGSRRGLPGQVTGVIASDDNCTAVNVSWNNVAGEDSFRVLRNGVQIASVPADILTYADVTAVPLVTYNYTVVAMNVCGAAPASTADPGTRRDVPLQVTGVTATTGLCTGVNIGWTTVTGADSFLIYRDTNLIFTTGPSATSYPDTSVHDASLHNYTVAAKNVCGIGPVSAPPAQGRRNAQPPAIVGLTATNNNCAAVILSWNSAAGADSFQIRRGGSRIGVAVPTATTYSDLTATPGQSYPYVVVSYNACGIGSVPTAVQGTRTLPAVVTGLTTTTNRCDMIRLHWNTAPSPVQIYRIYQNQLLVGMVDSTVTTFDVHPGGPGSWVYSISQWSAECGEGARSDTMTGTMQTQPTPATNVQATTNRCDGVLVSWTHGTGAIDGYIVRRGTTNIDTTTAAATNFLDTAAPVGNSPYQVRPYSINCTQPAFSPAVTGTRTPMPIAPANVAASANQCNRVQVTWADLADETGYHIYRDSVQVGSVNVNVLVFFDSSATVGNHNYAVVGINTCGEGTRSTAVPGTFNAVPAQVTTLAASQDSCSSVTLTWQDVAHADRYRILRGGLQIDSVNQGFGTYRDDTLSPGTYGYTIVPVNVCGAGPVSVSVNGRVESVPALITDLAATTNLCHITVTWADLPNELYYVLFRDSTLLVTLPQNTVGFVDTTATIGVHHYALQAENHCGSGTLSAYVTGERQGPPTDASVLTGPDSTCTEATITWSAVTHVTGFHIYRNGELLETVGNVTTYQATVSTPGTYTFAVQGLNDCGGGPMSNTITILFKPVPPQVTGVTASTISCTNITVTWNDVSGETGYHIYRADTLIGSVGRDTLTFTDNNVSVGSHLYRVAAFNECGTGQNSDPGTGVRRGPPALVTNLQASDTICTAIVLTWNNVADETRVVILRNNGRLDSVNADITTYTDNTAAPGTTYAYRVFALNDCGHGDTSAVDNGTRPDVPAQVTGLTASANRCDGIYLAWNNLASETRYLIFRDAVMIDSVAADTAHYLDAAVAVGAPHVYTVRARNQCGLGAMSANATGTRLQAPGVPASVTLRDSCGAVFIWWTAAPGNVDAYRFYRDGNVFEELPADTVVYMTFDPIVGTHSYTVRAYSNNCGLGNPSAAQNGTGHAAPGVPTNLTAAPAMCDSVRLTWTASTGEVTRYRIFRDGSFLDSTTLTRYRDTTLTNSVNHNYAVASFNPWCGQSALAGPVTAHLLRLVTMGTIDTVHCDDTAHVTLQHCSAVTSADVYLSINGGTYVLDTTITPVGNVANIIMPDTSHVSYPNCRLRLVSHRGTRTDSDTSNTFVLDCRLSSPDLISSVIPKDFYLDQNYPNPFNPSTVIRFGVPKTAEVKIAVYDILGREVATLVNRTMQPGVHAITWDCSACPSGMYLIRLQTGDRAMMRKMLLMK